MGDPTLQAAGSDPAGSPKKAQKAKVAKSPSGKGSGTGYGGNSFGEKGAPNKAAGDALKRQQGADKAMTQLLAEIRECLSMVSLYLCLFPLLRCLFPHFHPIACMSMPACRCVCGCELHVQLLSAIATVTREVPCH